MTGLRGRMVLAVVATSIATLAAATLVLAPLLEQRLERDRLSELRDLTRAIRPALRKTPAGDRAQLIAIAARLQRRTGGRIVILDRQGRTLADTAPAVDRPQRVLDNLEQERARVLAERDHVLSGTRGRLAFAATVVGTGRLMLVIAKPLDDTRAAASVVRAALPVSLAAGLAVAVALALLLSHSLLRRLRRLATDAAALGTSGLEHPVAVHGRDEVATVAEALETMRSRLAAEESSRVAFLGTASHELRTPLAALQATLELLREEALRGEDSATTTVARADTALRQTRRLVGLATELLELSRLDSNAPLATEPIDLVEVAESTSREFRDPMVSDGRAVHVEGSPAMAIANHAAAARILVILLDNANKYGVGTVRVRVQRADGEVGVTVQDEGDGVDPGEHERVFARFERGRAAGSASGAGLGLPIARGLAEAMGGRLDVTGDPRLNRFELWLPAAPSDLQEPPTTP